MEKGGTATATLETGGERQATCIPYPPLLILRVVVLLLLLLGAADGSNADDDNAAADGAVADNTTTCKAVLTTLHRTRPGCKAVGTALHLTRPVTLTSTCEGRASHSNKCDVKKNVKPKR
jgi:hypothetical protein